jgi:hypothetical protein
LRQVSPHPGAGDRDTSNRSLFVNHHPARQTPWIDLSQEYSYRQCPQSIRSHWVAALDLDVAAIQTNRDGRYGFRRVVDLELASGIESELLGARSASSRSAVLNTCMRVVSPFRHASMGSASCSRSATAVNDKCAAHFACRNLSSGARAPGIEIFHQSLPNQPLLQAMQYCLGFVQCRPTSSTCLHARSRATTSAIVSLLYVMQNGESAEIAVVGNEGVCGCFPLFGR